MHGHRPSNSPIWKALIDKVACAHLADEYQKECRKILKISDLNYPLANDVCKQHHHPRSCHLFFLPAEVR